MTIDLKPAVALLALAGAAVFGRPAAYACGRPCPQLSLEDNFGAADSVFQGRVLSRADHSMTDLLTFEVLRTFKGRKRRKVVVDAASNTCDPLGDMARPGDTFLVFAATAQRAKDDPVKLTTGFCPGSIKLESKTTESEVLPQVERLSKAAKISPR